MIVTVVVFVFVILFKAPKKKNVGHCGLEPMVVLNFSFLKRRTVILFSLMIKHFQLPQNNKETMQIFCMPLGIQASITRSAYVSVCSSLCDALDPNDRPITIL